MVYGWRGKIGLITPCGGTALEIEFNKYCPEGIAPLTQHISFGKITRDDLADLADRAVEAAKILSLARPNLLVFCCTTGSLINGFGYDKELSDRLQQATGIPATTTATAVIEALRALGSEQLTVTTPYSDEVNAIEKQFLEDNGFEVKSISGLGFVDPSGIPDVTISQMYSLTRSTIHDDADTVFVSCNGIGVMEGISIMETDFARPVITSNQVTLWHALQTLGVRECPAPGAICRLQHV